MKCPKCGYLGFETIDRCRHCGYDFSLSVPVESPPELTLHHHDGPGEALADFDLSSLDTLRDSESTAGLDLNRLIGGRDTPVDFAAVAPRAPLALADTPARVPQPRAGVANAAAASGAAAAVGLPLFSRGAADAEDEPPISAPRPVRPPLSVRRATPDLTRGRRTPRPARHDEPRFALQLEPESQASAGTAATALHPGDVAGHAAARGGARALAMFIDFVLMLSIDAAIVYLTLAIAGLTMNDAGVLPRIPLAAFLVLLNGGYLVTFTAASGQTIGKMLTGIRVMRDDGRRVDIPGAVLRAGGCALSLLSAGVGYLPAFVTADGRALQDRIAGTRVVSSR